MAVTTAMIKELREATGAGILDCRKALEQANGDFDKAVDFLREKGLATAAKRADRDASEGMVEIYSHGQGRVGVMVEVNCETDFVAKNAEFVKFSQDILQVAIDKKPADLDALKAAGVVPATALRAKVFASGKIEKAVHLKGIAVTKGAREAIEAAKGKIED